MQKSKVGRCVSRMSKGYSSSKEVREEWDQSTEDLVDHSKDLGFGSE